MRSDSTLSLYYFHFYDISSLALVWSSDWKHSFRCDSNALKFVFQFSCGSQLPINDIRHILSFLCSLSQSICRDVSIFSRQLWTASSSLVWRILGLSTFISKWSFLFPLALSSFYWSVFITNYIPYSQFNQTQYLVIFYI